MRIKPLYIYLGAFNAFLVALIIFSSNGKNIVESASMQKQMPNDDIHRGMNSEGQMPSKSNVDVSAKRRIEKLRLAYKKNPNDTTKM